MKKAAVWFLFFLLVSQGVNLNAQSITVFEESFEDNKNEWTTRDTEQAFAGVAEGRYRISHKRGSGSWVSWKREVPLDPINGFEISTVIRQTQGSEEDAYGLLWGAKDAANFFGFTLRGSGYYRVYFYKDQEYKGLQNWTDASEFIKPTGEDNKLTIRRVGDRLSFYINDNYVFDTGYQKFFGDNMGYVVYGPSTIEVDDLRISEERNLPITFNETFRDANISWFRGDGDTSQAQRQNGAFFLRGASSGSDTYEYTEVDLDSKNDFDIEATLKQVSGKKDRGYGLVWGARKQNHAFTFMVNSLGAYRVYKQIAGFEEVIQDWTPTDQVLYQDRGDSRLTVKKRGDELNFYLNDVYLSSAPFEGLYGSQIGFVVNDTSKIRIKSLRVRQGGPLAVGPPEFTWFSPENVVTKMAGNKIKIRSGVKYTAALKRLSLYVNDQLIDEQVPVMASNGFDGYVEGQVQLESGDNLIRIEVEDASTGRVTESIRTVKVEAMEKPTREKGTDYALFFASDDYEYWTDLVNPVKDARTVAGELRAHYGFEVEIVENATRKDVLKKLKQYAKRHYEPEDQLMIFFAGHGKFDELFGEGYVVTVDSDRDDEGNESYISHSSLRTIVNAISCEHTFLVMDVCFGGTIDPFIAQASHRGDDFYKEISQSEFIERKMRFKTRRYLTSGGKEYVPDGSPGHHSPFVRKFLEALRNYGGHDRIITLSELLLYFERLMPEPRFGEFGVNEPGSDFLFIAR